MVPKMPTDADTKTGGATQAVDSNPLLGPTVNHKGKTRSGPGNAVSHLITRDASVGRHPGKPNRTPTIPNECSEVQDLICIRRHAKGLSLR